MPQITNMFYFILILPQLLQDTDSYHFTKETLDPFSDFLNKEWQSTSGKRNGRFYRHKLAFPLPLWIKDIMINMLDAEQ